MASWNNNGWMNRSFGWDDRSREWDDRSRGWDDRSRGWDGRSRGWTENAWQSWGHTNNEGGGQWEDWGDSQEQNESIDQDVFYLGDIVTCFSVDKTDAERQSMLYSPDPVTNELIPIESPIVPQSRRPPKLVRLVPQSPTSSTLASQPFDSQKKCVKFSEPLQEIHEASPSCTPVSQTLDSHVHEEMREAYQDTVEVPGTSSADPTAVAEVPGTSSTDPPAVAENPTAVAVAVMEPLIVPIGVPTAAFDLAYFQAFQPFTGGYKQHNLALKSIRDLAEYRGMNFMVFSNDQPMDIPVCVHPAGMLFSIDYTQRTLWNWKEMVALLDEDSMKRVVEGPNAAVAEGIKIVGCAIVKTDRHDQKRNYAFKDKSIVFHIWDFVFFRSDGSQIGCHPDYSTTRIGSYEGHAKKDHELPKGGKGGSSGRGTYKYFKKKGIDLYLRFDAEKKPPRTHTRQRE